MRYPAHGPADHPDLTDAPLPGRTAPTLARGKVRDRPPVVDVMGRPIWDGPYREVPPVTLAPVRWMMRPALTDAELAALGATMPDVPDVPEAPPRRRRRGA